MEQVFDLLAQKVRPRESREDVKPWQDEPLVWWLLGILTGLLTIDVPPAPLFVTTVVLLTTTMMGTSRIPGSVSRSAGRSVTRTARGAMVAASDAGNHRLVR